MKNLSASIRKNASSYSGRVFSDRKWILPFLASLLVSITLFLSAAFGLFASSYGGHHLAPDELSLSKPETSSGYFVESDLKEAISSSESSKLEAPRIAYLISGTKGDARRMLRTLQAVYHPRNQYILHLDLEAPLHERVELGTYVKSDPIFLQVGNVRVMRQSNMVTYKGPTMIASTLQAVAIMLRESLEWDWFINLSASDYPLMTQDDLLHVFSNVSRSLNFIEHMKPTGWKLTRRAKPIIIDPGLHLSKKSDLALTTQRRSLPTAFKLFTGSAWAMLTRSFMEYCVIGWENLPRTLLMYYTNFISSPEGYFHTVICNNEDFRNTAVSHDLHYIAWDTPPKQHPISLTMKDFDRMVKSNAPFARKFAREEEPVLDRIDRELLGRTTTTRFAPGAWCYGGSSSINGTDPCSVVGDSSKFMPGPGAKRLQQLLKSLLSADSLKKQCS